MEFKNIFQEVLSQIDIVNTIDNYLTLSKKGKNYLAICPFHEDSKPSLTISSDKQIFKCFVCNQGGNAIAFVEKYLKISSMEALKIIAADNGLNIKFENNQEQKKILTKVQQKLTNLNEIALTIFKYNIFDKKNILLNKFLQARKIDDEDIIEYFELGFSDSENIDIKIKKRDYSIDDALLLNSSLVRSNKSNFFENRFIFSIRDEHDNLVGFSGREISKNSENVKYLNTAENSLFSKNKILYNFNRAKETILYKKEMIICEGFMDVIALHKIGYKNAIALMGTAFTENQINLFKKIKNLKIIFFLDGDAAGQKATIKSLNKIINLNMEIEIIENHLKMDPDEILNNLGEKNLKEILNSRKNAFEFLLEYFIKEHDLNEIKGIIQFCNDYSQYFKFASNDIKSIMLNKIKNLKKIPEDLIKKYFNDKVVSTKSKKAENIFLAENIEIQNDVNVDDEYIASLEKMQESPNELEIRKNISHKNNKQLVNDFRLWPSLNQSEKVILSLFDSYNKDPEKEFIVLYGLKKAKYVLKNITLNEIGEKFIKAYLENLDINKKDFFTQNELKIINELKNKKDIQNYPKYNEKNGFETLLKSLKEYEQNSQLLYEIQTKIENQEKINDNTISQILEIIKKRNN